MRKKLIFLLILLLTWSCFKFKESPLDPTTPTGMILKLLEDQQPRRLKIFVTYNTFQGDIGGGAGSGIQRADNMCNFDLNKSDNNTYKAMIVDEIVELVVHRIVQIPTKTLIGYLNPIPIIIDPMEHICLQRIVQGL